MQLRSGTTVTVAVAVAKANSCSSNWTPRLGISICHRCTPSPPKRLPQPTTTSRPAFLYGPAHQETKTQLYPPVADTTPHTRKPA